MGAAVGRRWADGGRMVVRCWIRSPLATFGMVAALVGQVSAQARMGGGFVYTEQEAVLPTLPEVAVSGIVDQAEWSPDGRYVLASRAQIPPGSGQTFPPPLEGGLVLWERETRRATELWKAKGEREGHPEFQWLASGGVAFVLLDQWPQRPPGTPPAERPAPERWLLRVDARHAQLRPVGRVPDDARLFAAPTQAAAALMSAQEATVRLLQADGSTKQVVRLPPGAELSSGAWSEDGGSLIVEALAPAPQQGEVVRAGSVYAVDLRSGQLTLQRGEQRLYRPKEPALPLRLRQSSVTVKEGPATERLRPLWLEGTAAGGPTLALICPDAVWGRLSPRGDAVLYASAGGAWVTPLLRLPRQQFTEARDAAIRAALTSNARQLALGLMLYAQDHDGMLPAAGDNIRDLIMPYVKSEPLFEGFVYQYSGGSLHAITEPAKTLLGYVPGPGGRANLFADGHAMWQPDH